MAESYMWNCNDVFNTYFEQQQIIEQSYQQVDKRKLKIHNGPKNNKTKSTDSFDILYQEIHYVM